jgi:hypothetical protein
LSGELADVQKSFTSRGTASSKDYTLATLTADSAYHDLDLSAILPAGTTAVHIWIGLTDNAVGTTFAARKNGETGFSRVYLGTQVANVTLYGDFWVGCDTNRVIEYLVTTGADDLDVVILGWLK